MDDFVKSNVGSIHALQSQILIIRSIDFDIDGHNNLQYARSHLYNTWHMSKLKHFRQRYLKNKQNQLIPRFRTSTQKINPNVQLCYHKLVCVLNDSTHASLGAFYIYFAHR